ncbi:unnamed protein product [Oikopleura dioica]|uniref:Sulfotransferase n=1 Tax=Oikopleura dioica TaxID=34765 RepID=E4XYB3_OIKDI|nr:unnamed protein product [Oikopleura dioica]
MFSRVRRAIEDATGIYTGSSMNEEYFHKLGFEGELEQYASGRVIASKNQGIAFVEYTEGMIVLGTVRNPYDAIAADFHRQARQAHLGYATPEEYAQSEEWKACKESYIIRWSSTAMFFAQFANVTEVPLKTVFYEDFVENPVQETHNILRFYKKNFDFKPANLNWDCVTKGQEMFENKEREVQNTDIFSDEDIKTLDTESFFKALKLPDIPNSYYHSGKAPKTLPSPDEAISAHGTMTKIKRAITPRYTFIKEGSYEFHSPQSTSFLQYGWIKTKQL